MRLRYLFAALCLSLAIPTPAHALTWKTVVYDSFNSGGVPGHWRLYNARYGSPLNDNCADPKHVTVSGGMLHLKLFWQPTGKCGADWYSGGMGLDNALSAPNQRVTVRWRIVSVNNIHGHRIIPMLSSNNGTGNGEMDYCESEAAQMSNCMTFLHWAWHSGRTDHRNYYNLYNWHTMTFTRVGYHVTSVIDGNPEFDYWGNETTLPSTLKHVVLQQECPWHSCPAGRTGYEDIQIDYIKVENSG